MRRATLLALAAGVAVLVAGCNFGGRDLEAETQTLQPPTPDPAAPTPTPNADLAIVREIGFGYWDRFNAYDLDGVLALLEPAYREERRSQLKSDIGRVDQFDVKLRPTVLEEPVFTAADRAQMAFRLRTPIDIRRIEMRFVRAGSSWLITFVEERDS